MHQESYRPVKGDNIKKEMAMPEFHKPRLTLNSSDLPEVAEWKPGETYYLGLKVRQTSSHMDEKEKHTEATFEIVGVRDESEGSEEDYNRKYEKAKHG